MVDESMLNCPGGTIEACVASFVGNLLTIITNCEQERDPLRDTDNTLPKLLELDINSRLEERLLNNNLQFTPG